MQTIAEKVRVPEDIERQAQIFESHLDELICAAEKSSRSRKALSDVQIKRRLIENIFRSHLNLLFGEDA